MEERVTSHGITKDDVNMVPRAERHKMFSTKQNIQHGVKLPRARETARTKKMSNV